MKHIARKRFGQHFLTDAVVLAAIVREINPHPGEALVEIGPGLGALTLPVLALCEHMQVVELDRDLAAKLRQRTGIDVIEADALKVDFSALAAPTVASDDAAEAPVAARRLRVIGNLPYNISTPILFHLLGHVDAVLDQHFMLQKEVVDRMAASPGSKDFGRLTVMLQWRYDIEALFDVPPEAFDPPPRVNSSIVRMTPLPAAPDVDHAVLAELVSMAFSQRRKMLRNTLGVWLEAHQTSGDFDLQRRAEEVPVAEFVALAARVSRQESARTKQ